VRKRVSVFDLDIIYAITRSEAWRNDVYYFIRDESVLRIKNSEAVTPERRIIRAK